MRRCDTRQNTQVVRQASAMHPRRIATHIIAVMLTAPMILGLAVKQAMAESPGALLIAATQRGDLEVVQQLLRQGVDPNAYDTVHNTPLIFAARDGRLPIARALLAAGAQVNWMDDEHVTPLILAVFKGHADLVGLLLEHGADPTIRDQWHRTALDYALRRGEDHALVKILRFADTQAKQGQDGAHLSKEQ